MFNVGPTQNNAINTTKAKNILILLKFLMPLSIPDQADHVNNTVAITIITTCVPKLEGILRMTGTIDLDGGAVNYNTPYAKAQFYGFVGRGGYRVRNYTTPGTSRRWDLRVKANHMQDLERAYLKGAGY